MSSPSESNYIEHSYSRKAKSRSAGQGVQDLLWNQKVHYSVHNSPPMHPILSTSREAGMKQNEF
jgi:hypothetical protein